MMKCMGGESFGVLSLICSLIFFVTRVLGSCGNVQAFASGLFMIHDARVDGWALTWACRKIPS
jgi:hypothetical protein